ncbi:hypothetical protein Nepgr_024487 [Nepenthes gracilis]|uniref:Uncharacterized protein n=1 Tax=Nepenthes gracilis TaxID=150966 RepID=A0AAD3T4Q6_NEPGR|nr:hypothetical protein Nepgr_024487 [Nepenthes gracilis]
MELQSKTLPGRRQISTWIKLVDEIIILTDFPEGGGKENWEVVVRWRRAEKRGRQNSVPWTAASDSEREGELAVSGKLQIDHAMSYKETCFC